MIDEITLVRVLKAVGHPKRFRMIQEIAAAGELSCGQICDRFEVSQPTISHHMKILAEAGVLVCREAGQHRFISVNRSLIREVARFLPGRLSVAPPARRTGDVRPRATRGKTRARSSERPARP